MKLRQLHRGIKEFTPPPTWRKPEPIRWYGDGPTQFREFSAELPKYGRCKVSIDNMDTDNPFSYNIFVRGDNGDELGHEEIMFNFFDNYIFGKEMEVEEAFQREYRVGELLRLTSIMELFQNKMDKIKIFSTKNAIMFHSKYKFQPEIASPNDRLKTMSLLLRTDEKGTSKIKNQIYRMMEELKKVDGSSIQTQWYQDLIARSDALIGAFIQKIIKNNKNVMPNRQPFESGFDMILTKENIIANKDGFNILYKNHNIDFQI